MLVSIYSKTAAMRHLKLKADSVKANKYLQISMRICIKQMNNAV